MKTILALLLSLQLVSLAVLIFGDIGFDHPGRFGLSFNHGLFFTICYFATLLAGLAFATKKRRWKTVVLQLIVPVLMVVEPNWPVPQYRSLDYQFLVGKSENEVQDTLSSRRVSYGVWGEYETASYGGMMVLYDDSGKVVMVTDDHSEYPRVAPTVARD